MSTRRLTTDRLLSGFRHEEATRSCEAIRRTFGASASEAKQHLGYSMIIQLAHQGRLRRVGRGLYRRVNVSSTRNGRVRFGSVRKLIVPVGKKFGRLTVISTGRKRGTSKSVWRCRCSCGNIVNVRSVCLRRTRTYSDGTVGPSTASCGCLMREMVKKANTTHGHTADGRISPEYTSWIAMINRVDGNMSKERYFDKGIRCCRRWRSFENFLADMGPRPKGMSLDRFPDKRGDYKPSNCRWATPHQQARNRTSNKMLRFNGETRCVAEWSERFGINESTIYRRIKIGMSLRQILAEFASIDIKALRRSIGLARAALRKATS